MNKYNLRLTVALVLVMISLFSYAFFLVSHHPDHIFCDSASNGSFLEIIGFVEDGIIQWGACISIAVLIVSLLYLVSRLYWGCD